MSQLCCCSSWSSNNSLFLSLRGDGRRRNQWRYSSAYANTNTNAHSWKLLGHERDSRQGGQRGRERRRRSIVSIIPKAESSSSAAAAAAAAEEEEEEEKEERGYEEVPPLSSPPPPSDARLGMYRNRFLFLAKLRSTISRGLESFFKSEVRQRTIVTVSLLALIRAGHFIPLPGFDRRFMPGDYLTHTLEEVGESSELRLSFFQLGIGPYMGASIIMQVLCYMLPYLVRLRKEGIEGSRRIKKYTETLAFGLAVFQALIYSFHSAPYSLYAGKNMFGYIAVTTSILSAGALLINWICNKISDAGFGQGPSLFICVNILTGYADSLYKVISSLVYRGGNWLPPLAALLGFSFFFTICAVLTSTGHRKINLQYYNFELASKAGVGGTLAEVEPYIPFGINPTGMQPLLTTTIVMALPEFVARLTGNSFWMFLKDALKPGSAMFNPWLFHGLTISFIFLFNISDLGNIPVELNQYLMKIGARIPKIKPGQQTVEYLSKVQASTRFWGGVLLSLLVTTSTLVDSYFRHLQLGDSIGFTSMLIIVGAILDLRRTFLAYNVMPSLSKVLSRFDT